MGIELAGALQISGGADDVFGIAGADELECVGGAEAGVSEGVIRVESDGLLEVMNGRGERLGLHRVDMLAGADVVLVGGHVARLGGQNLLPVGGVEADGQGLEDSGDDAVLHVEGVVPQAVDLLGCEGVAGSGVDERRGNADAVADALIAAADNPARTEVAADLHGDAGIALGAAEPAQTLDHADAAGDADGPEFREIGGEAFGDADAEPVEVGGAADVAKSMTARVGGAVSAGRGPTRPYKSWSAAAKSAASL